MGEFGEEILVGPGPAAPAPTESVNGLVDDSTSSIGS